MAAINPLELEAVQRYGQPLEAACESIARRLAAAADFPLQDQPLALVSCVVNCYLLGSCTVPDQNNQDAIKISTYVLFILNANFEFGHGCDSVRLPGHLWLPKQLTKIRLPTRGVAQLMRVAAGQQRCQDVPCFMVLQVAKAGTAWPPTGTGYAAADEQFATYLRECAPDLSFCCLHRSESENGLAFHSTRVVNPSAASDATAGDFDPANEHLEIWAHPPRSNEVAARIMNVRI
jgi:hypothetical protein